MSETETYQQNIVSETPHFADMGRMLIGEKFIADFAAHFAEMTPCEGWSFHPRATPSIIYARKREVETKQTESFDFKDVDDTDTMVERLLSRNLRHGRLALRSVPVIVKGTYVGKVPRRYGESDKRSDVRLRVVLDSDELDGIYNPRYLVREYYDFKDALGVPHRPPSPSWQNLMLNLGTAHYPDDRNYLKIEELPGLKDYMGQKLEIAPVGSVKAIEARQPI